MIRLKFKDSTVTYEVEFSIISNNVIQIIGDIPESTSGFELYRMNNAFLGDYSDYKYILKKVDLGIQFTNKAVPAEVNEDTVTIPQKFSNIEKQLTDLQLALVEVYEGMVV